MLKRSLTYFGWSIVIFFSFYYVYMNALRYFDYTSPVYTADKKPFAFGLVLHIFCGILALLLGPLQFSGNIRKARPAIHRAIGKVYLTAIFISALASFYLSIQRSIVQRNMLAMGTGLMGLALAWLCTSAMAYLAIRSRNFIQHREWMIRSYVVTCGFVTFRIFFDLLVKTYEVNYNEAAALTGWACWALPLLVTEVVLQAPKLRKSDLKVSNKGIDYYSPSVGHKQV